MFVLAMLGMALGVALTGKRLAGSCGGLGSESCGCSPEKRARCQAKGEVSEHRVSLDDEDEDYQLNPLARPGEDRLIQLGRR